MAYSNAVFYLDPDLGNDAARTALTTVTVSNPSGTITRCNKTAHGLVTGAVVDLTLFSAWLNAAWKITVVDANNFDLDGAVWQTTADNNGTVTPRGGSSMADAWKTVNNGATSSRHAPGDTLRFKASPDPTSLGQAATWTDGPQKTTVSIASSTNATPIVLSLTAPNYSALAPAVGDTVIVNGHSTNTNANGVWTISAVNGSTSITLQDAQGANSVGNGAGAATGTVRKINNMVVKLTTPVTKNIALCGNQGTKPNWTAANANVVNSVSTSDFKEGGESQNVAITAAFTTGLAAYFPTGTLDLSGYQQVAFWIKQTVGTIGAAGAVSLKLCTDVAGATPVHSIDIPALGTTSNWTQVVVDLGINMNAAIRSVALYVNTDNGAQTFMLDNIIACKASSSADSLTLASLISKNTGYEAWYGIQSINGTRVMLDQLANTIPALNPQRGYSGTTETVTTYKREAFKTVLGASGANVMFTQLAGTAAAYIAYTGGWNRTDMSTQTGETWFDGQNGVGNGLGDQGNPRSFLSFDKLNFARYANGFSSSTATTLYQNIGSMAACNCTSFGINLSGNQTTANSLSVVGCNTNVNLGNGVLVNTIARADNANASGIALGLSCSIAAILQANNCQSTAVTMGANSYVGAITCGGSGTGVLLANNCVIGTLTATNNNSSVGCTGTHGSKILGGSSSGTGVGINGSNSGSTYLRNFTANDTLPFSAPTNFSNTRLHSERHNGAADTHVITTDGGTIVSATDQRNTASGISWKFRPTSTIRASGYPLYLPLAKLAVTAGTPVSVRISVRRDSTNIKGQLRLPGGQLAGVPNDVTVACEPALNTWEQSGALTFTPTETGVVEVLFEVWDGVGATNNFWIDDLVIA